MLATPGALPTDDAGWAYEIKWDGVRALCSVDGATIRLLSRNDKDLTSSFPEIQQTAEAIDTRRCVLDGEIVVIGDDGVPDFGRLQRRLHLSNAMAVRKQAATSPASYVVFDLLHLNGKSLESLPYDARRKQLEGLHLTRDSFITADSYRDVHGADVLQATRDAGLEGVIAKRRNSPYIQGKRSEAWIKVKNARMQEVVIGGWTDGAGNLKGTMGALLLGMPSPDGLRFVGKVGTGFTDRDRDSLVALLRRTARKTSPFVTGTDVEDPAPHFVRPALVGEVRYAEWTGTGRLRHPVWRGLRADKLPEDVVVEG
jgi:bifunctional non-homologous end joining protein LigD